MQQEGLRLDRERDFSWRRTHWSGDGNLEGSGAVWAEVFPGRRGGEPKALEGLLRPGPLLKVLPVVGGGLRERERTIWDSAEGVMGMASQ